MNQFINKTNKLFGEYTAIPGSELVIPKRLTTGSLGLDVILGGGWPGNQWCEIRGRQSAGKALALDTPLRTPFGWTTMGEVTPGVTLFDEKGNHCRVIFVTEVQHDRKCYRITFKDGSSLIADADHLWQGFEKSDGSRIKEHVFTTQHMIDAGLQPSSGKFWKFHIPTAEPLQFTDSQETLIVDPYVLGVWLGDGKSVDERIYTNDHEVIDEIERAGFSCKKNKSPFEYSLSGLYLDLKRLGILGNKHVPEEYLSASVDDRLHLLQGLMDSDGYSDLRGHCEFTSINKILAENVRDLLLSLGHRVHWGEGEATISGRYISQKYRLTFQSEFSVFRIPRKNSRQSSSRSQFAMVRSVVSIDSVESVPVRCIQVDSPSHLYLAGRDLIPTHNTAIVYKSIAANQKLDPDFTTLWIAAESYDVGQAAALGVDNSRVTVIPTQQMEFAFEMMVEGAQSKEFDLIALDSYPALVPDEEAEKAMDEFTTAMGARNMNKFIRKAGLATRRSPDGSERPMCGIIINQFRDKIGGFARYGVPQTTPGGHGKDYFYYVILKIARDEFITEKRPGVPDPVTVGQTIKITTEKNKSSAPNQAIALDFYFREAPVLGFHRGDYDSAKDYFSMALLFRVVQKKGGWYYYSDQKWQGKDKTLSAIYEDTVLREEIADQVLAATTNPALMDQLVTNGNGEEE